MDRFVTHVRWLGVALLLFCAQPGWAETTTYMVTDAQGTVVAQVDSAGHVTYEAAYRPYGRQGVGIPQAGPGYTGHVNDPDTGLVYMQQRYYDPDRGGFLSVDPVGLTPGSLFNFNRYDYANNNPINYTDPDGRCPDGMCGEMLSAHVQWRMSHPNAPTDGLEKASFVGVGVMLTASGLDAVVEVAEGTAVLDRVLSDSPAPSTAGPKPAENFVSPTNSPQDPPTTLPDGHTVRVMPKSTEQYPNGYWRQYDSKGNPVNPSTGRQPGSVSRAESRAQTHVPLPPPKPTTAPPPPPPVIPTSPPLQ